MGIGFCPPGRDASDAKRVSTSLRLAHLLGHRSLFQPNPLKTKSECQPACASPHIAVLSSERWRLRVPGNSTIRHFFKKVSKSVEFAKANCGCAAPAREIPSFVRVEESISGRRCDCRASLPRQRFLPESQFGTRSPSRTYRPKVRRNTTVPTHVRGNAANQYLG